METRSAPPVPTITDRNVIVVHIVTRRDDLGRARFYAFWLDDNIGPGCNETGTRGQVSHTNVDQWVAKRRAEGRHVDVVEHDAQP
jgi:hypothetical protein